MKLIKFVSAQQNLIIATIAGLGIVSKLIFFLIGYNQLGNQVLFYATLVGFIPLLVEVVRSLLKGNFGIDFLALLSIGGSLLLGEYLAGIIVVLMLSGGEMLEDFAMKRSQRELTKLVNSLPTSATVEINGKLVEQKIAEVELGSNIIVRQGESIPIDGILISANGNFDESNITGESIPVEKNSGEKIYSGSVAVTGPLKIETNARAEDSRYQQLVKLVKQAVEAKAPFVRIADKYAIWFTIVALVIAGFGFVISGGSWLVALSVLVVATPCPLILATPIAFSSGVTIAARKGAIFKSGKAIEQLAKFTSLVFDKTGTLTVGRPELEKVIWESEGKHNEQDVLNAVSSIERFSKHVLSESLVKLGKSENFDDVKNFQETFGQGIKADYQGKSYLIGSEKFLNNNDVKFELDSNPGFVNVYVAIQNELVAVLLLKDKAKPESRKILKELTTKYNVKPALLTGDKTAVASEMAKNFGIDEVVAEASPEDKLEFIKKKQAQGLFVAMVGDGINDAPAIAQANVGIALDTWGSSATTEAADVVLTSKNLDVIPNVINISKGVLRVATQGIWMGIGLSLVLMVVAAFGYLPPTFGALSQEIIDVIVIVNALRVRNLA